MCFVYNICHNFKPNFC